MEQSFQYSGRISREKDITFLAYTSLLILASLIATKLLGKSYYFQFWLLTGIVLIHNIVELLSLYRSNPKHFILQPIVLGSIVIFLMQGGGITNFLMLDNDLQFVLLYNDKIEKEPYWLAFGMSIVLASSVAYWAGFKLAAGRHLFNIYNATYRKFLNYNISIYSLVSGWFIGCIIKLIINHYGGIGHKYIILVQSAGELPGIVSRLKVFENMSLLFLMMILFWVYKYGKNMVLVTILIVGILFELIFAITSGARGTIVFLFLSLFVVDYYFRDKIKLVWLVIGGLVLYGSMTIISKYKDYIFTSREKAIEISNPFESIQLAILYNDNKVFTKKQMKAIKESSRISTIGRFTYVNEMVQMMYYKNKIGLKKEDPDFTTPFLTFPIFAILPKYYIFGISDPAYGYWVNDYLVGGTRTSIAISPFGFTYLAGGTAFVLFIFAILGILMKAASFLLSNIRSVIGFILFIAIMQHLVLFDTVVYGTFINLIRFGLVLPPLLWVIAKK